MALVSWLIALLVKLQTRLDEDDDGDEVTRDLLHQ